MAKTKAGDSPSLSRLKKKLAAKRDGSKPTSKKKTKVKVRDISSEEDAPWDEDDSHDSVRQVGLSEDPDDDEGYEEAFADFTKSMKRVSEKVADARQPYNSPATQEMVTRQALASVLRLLPEAEGQYKLSKAERAAYAYTNLQNNARELMADLRAMSSTDMLADKVIQEAVTPAFLQLVNFVITEVANIRTKVNGTSSGSVDGMKRHVNELLTKMLESLATYGDEALASASEKARHNLKG